MDGASAADEAAAASAASLLRRPDLVENGPKASKRPRMHIASKCQQNDCVHGNWNICI